MIGKRIQDDHFIYSPLFFCGSTVYFILYVLQYLSSLQAIGLWGLHSALESRNNYLSPSKSFMMSCVNILCVYSVNYLVPFNMPEDHFLSNGYLLFACMVSLITMISSIKSGVSIFKSLLFLLGKAGTLFWITNHFPEYSKIIFLFVVGLDFNLINIEENNIQSIIKLLTFSSVPALLFVLFQYLELGCEPNTIRFVLIVMWLRQFLLNQSDVLSFIFQNFLFSLLGIGMIKLGFALMQFIYYIKNITQWNQAEWISFLTNFLILAFIVCCFIISGLILLQRGEEGVFGKAKSNQIEVDNNTFISITIVFSVILFFITFTLNGLLNYSF